MAPRFPASLETEIGAPGVVSYPGYIANFETTVELQWPRSIQVYDYMRRSDAQTRAVLNAQGLPIRRTRWQVRGDDVDPRVATFVRTELGLDEQGHGRRRRRGQGISWDDLLRHILMDTSYGHMAFEPVYAIAPPGPDQAAVPGMPPLLAHFDRISPRLPQTIGQFLVAANGDLEGIVQWVFDATGNWSQRTIPADRLFLTVNEQEGADYTGTSSLRSSYKHWLLKEMLERLGPMAVERNGMGVPVVTFDPAIGNESRALQLARAFRSGEEAGFALPLGYSLKLQGVEGQVRDELQLLQYHKNEIGKNALAMVLDLGHDRGARSLGQTFLDVMVMALNAKTAAVEEFVTELIVRRLVMLNFGEDEAYPEVVADEIEPDAPATADGLAHLVKAGVIIPDPDLEDEIRRRYELPPANPLLDPGGAGQQGDLGVDPNAPELPIVPGQGPGQPNPAARPVARPLAPAPGGPGPGVPGIPVAAAAVEQRAAALAARLAHRRVLAAAHAGA